MDLAERKKFIPPLVDRILTAKSLEFSAETQYSGIEFVPMKETKLIKEQTDELNEIESFNRSSENADYNVSSNNM